jgi:predicted lipoprotein with Yx(FWY)xxD motif
MYTKTLLGILGAATFTLAACGSTASGAGSAYGGYSATPTTAAAPAPAAATASSLGVAHTSLGDVLVDGQGRTLYALTKDANGMPTCTGGCAIEWPPATVTGTAMAAAGVTAPTTTVAAPGGGQMLKAGKWPLYRFSGDSKAGDVNGQGIDGTWFVVGANGQLIKA